MTVASAALVSMSGLRCRPGAEPPGELLGSWRLVSVCFYERDAPPCEIIGADEAPVFSFLPDGRFTTDKPDHWGKYRLETNVLPDGREQMLIHLDGGIPAQLTVSSDSLVISWAYADGAERRYLRAER